MSDSQQTKASLWIAAIAALAGFGAVYLTLAGSGNDGTATDAPPAVANAGAPVVGAGSGAFKLGKMAAFVTKKLPEPVPDITFEDSAGGKRKLSDFKGRTILLNLWATWCAPCRNEMPGLNRLQQELGSDKFEVVALSLDRQGAAASQKFLTDVGATSLNLYVDSTAKQGLALKLLGMPTTILIDADGLEVGRLAGEAEWDSDEAKNLVRSAIK